MRDDPPAFLGVLSFAMSCNVPFSRKRYPCHFFLLFESFRSFDEILRVMFIVYHKRSPIELNPSFYRYSSKFNVANFVALDVG